MGSRKKRLAIKNWSPSCQTWRANLKNLPMPCILRMRSKEWQTKLMSKAKYHSQNRSYCHILIHNKLNLSKRNNKLNQSRKKRRRRRRKRKSKRKRKWRNSQSIITILKKRIRSRLSSHQKRQLFSQRNWRKKLIRARKVKHSVDKKSPSRLPMIALSLQLSTIQKMSTSRSQTSFSTRIKSLWTYQLPHPKRRRNSTKNKSIKKKRNDLMPNTNYSSTKIRVSSSK